MLHRSASRLRIDTTIFSAKSLRLFAADDAQPHEWRRMVERMGARSLETVAGHPRPLLHAAVLSLAAIAAAVSTGG